MSLQRPRRIFVGSSQARRRSSTPVAAVLAGAFGIAVGVVALQFLLPANLFGRIAPVEGAVRADPGAVAVVDGETLVLHGSVVRLDGVAAPARGRMCRDVAGARFDCGAAAARALATLVRDQVLTCRLSGRDTGGFVQADCQAGATNLNHAIVAAGWARASASGTGVDAGLQAEERQARATRLGLWADPDALAM